jgi:hypothetical protein
MRDGEFKPRAPADPCPRPPRAQPCLHQLAEDLVVLVALRFFLLPTASFFGLPHAALPLRHKCKGMDSVFLLHQAIQLA